MTGSQHFIATDGVSGVTVPIFQSIWGRKGLGLFGSNQGEQIQQIKLLSQQYELKYQECHGIVKRLGIQEPVELESIYTPVQFFEMRDILGYEFSNLEEIYQKAQGCQLYDSYKVATQKQYLMVLGVFGAGKTTFLRWMGLQALKGKKNGFKHTCIPVFIELKNLNFTKINIQEQIIAEFQLAGFPEAEKLTNQALEQGKLLILLDGVDEVPTKQIYHVINHIQEFVDRYRKNRFIVSCRISAYRHNFRRFTEVAIANFNEAQVQNFMSNWFTSETEIGRCWQELNHPESVVKQFTQTPLLLTLACSLYQRSSEFPTNQAIFYQRALELLLTSRPIESDSQRLTPQQEQKILAEIAYEAFDDDRLFLPQLEIAAKIEKRLREIHPQTEAINSINIVKSIAIQSGVIVERSPGIYSFAYSPLQEYLTAQYIDHREWVEKTVTEHLTDERWHPIFVLLAALMQGGADELLLLLELAAQNYITSPKLQALLTWADRVTTLSAGNFPPVAKRAAATGIAYTIAIGNAHSIVNANAETIAKPHDLLNAYDIVTTNAKTNAKANAITSRKVSTTANAIAAAYGIANPYIDAYTNALATAFDNTTTTDNALAIASVFDNSQIFNNVEWEMVIGRLKALKSGVPDDNEPVEIRRHFIELLQLTWIQALHLDPDLLNLSPDEATALDNYFYISLLLVQCRQSAVRLLSETWEVIEARMLRG
ncbi:MAG: NACHT domain-containing protein [Nostocaceae cyanobacterium]|nr:NACHT domain-containing protein [Nostocaceae cyanobacterium]